MPHNVDQFLNFLSSLPPSLIYFFLGISAFVENIFPPIPGDTITVFGAFLVGTQRLSFLGVYLATTIGSLAGFMSLFWIGSALGRRFFIEKDYRFFSAKDIYRAEAWFQKYGYLLVLLNRFLPGVRSVISIVGGISKLKYFKTTFFAFISCAAWNLIWITVGYELGSNWDVVRQTIGKIMARYNMVVFGLMVCGLVIYLLRRRKKNSGG